MPYCLSTLLNKLDNLDNHPNALLIKEFYDYMTRNSLSVNHKLNNLRVIIPFSNYLGYKSFFDVKAKNKISNPTVPPIMIPLNPFKPFV